MPYFHSRTYVYTVVIFVPKNAYINFVHSKMIICLSRTFRRHLHFSPIGLFPFTFTALRNVLLRGDGTALYLLRINFGSWCNTFETTQILGRWVSASEPQPHSLVTSCVTIRKGRGGTAVSSCSIFDFLSIHFVPPSIRT